MKYKKIPKNRRVVEPGKIGILGKENQGKIGILRKKNSKISRKKKNQKNSYDMLHNRHKHRREEHLIKQRSVSFQDTQNRRKHMNSRRNDVSVLFCSLYYFFIIFIIYYNYRNGRIGPK